MFFGGDVSFAQAEFSGRTVSFERAIFSGGTVSFGGARFIGGTVTFDVSERYATSGVVADPWPSNQLPKIWPIPDPSTTA